MFTPESVRGFARHLRCLLLRRRVEIQGQCLRCGRCCQGMALYHNGGPIMSELHFEELCRSEPAYARFRIDSRTPTGLLRFSCAWIADGSCSGYGDRLDFCRRYPNPNIYFAGHDLLPGCGYAFVETPNRP